MSVLPPHSNTLTIAKESLAMSEKTGDKNFQKFAIGLMALTGIGTVLHAIHELWRDVQPKREKAQHTPRSHPAEPETDYAQADAPSQSWVKNARVSERPTEGERVWSKSLKHQGHGRHH